MLVLGLISYINVSSQVSKRTNIWYFGRNAGINFNITPPAPLIDGQINTWEGCATLCDTAGNILIYTDGQKIWNKNHQIIPGATNLGGNNSATQSGIIVPKSNSPNEYYVFSVDAECGNGGLRYSIIDMAQNGGLGGLVTSNNVMLTPSTEKVTVIKHCNNTDYWIIAHKCNSSDYYIWKLTSNGISPNPIITTIGTSHGGGIDAIGYLKANPKGDKIAVSTGYRNNKIEIYDFNNSTGAFSNLVTIKTPNLVNPYGLEFSPDGNLLYFAGAQNYPNVYIFQLNLRLPTVSEILSSITIVGRGTSSTFGALQNGPDGKIYIAKENSKFLSIIERPNQIGLSCNFKEDFFYLNEKKSEFGLPNLVPSFFENPVEVNIIKNIPSCADSGFLTISSNLQGNLNYQWYLNGNPLPNQINNSLKINESGRYKVEISTISDCQNTIIKYSKEILIVFPGLNSIVNKSICKGATFKGYSTSGVFVDTLTGINGCDSIRMINLIVLPQKEGVLNRIICKGKDFAGYTLTGTYIDTLKGVASNGCDSVRTIKLIVNPNYQVKETKNICAGGSYNFNGRIILNEGIYWDTIPTLNGCDSIIMLDLKIARLNFLAGDTTICVADDYTLKSPTENTIWFDNSISKTKKVNKTGNYWAKTLDANGCEIIDTVFVQFNYKAFVPNTFSPNKDGINDCFKPYFSEPLIGFYRFNIFDRWGNLVFDAETPESCWNGEYKRKECDPGVYTYSLEVDTEFCKKTIVKGVVTLIR